MGIPQIKVLSKYDIFEISDYIDKKCLFTIFFSGIRYFLIYGKYTKQTKPFKKNQESLKDFIFIIFLKMHQIFVTGHLGNNNLPIPFINIIK